MKVLDLAIVAQEAIYKETGKTVGRQVLLVGVKAIFDYIKKESLNRVLTIATFGTFGTKVAAPKKVNTRFTNGEVVVPAHRVVFFKPAPEFKSWARYSDEAIASLPQEEEAA